MDESAIAQYIIDNFDGVDTTIIPGGSFFFVDPQKMFAFATLITSDEFDGESNLAERGLYRLNMGIGKATFQSLFGAKPAKGEPAKEYDYTLLDQILPHPVYGKMYWVCVLSPSVETFEHKIKPLLSEAYELDVARHAK